MAHFAQLDGKNIVTQVIVVGDVDTADNNGNGQIDEGWEYDFDGYGISNWGEGLDDKKEKDKWISSRIEETKFIMESNNFVALASDYRNMMKNKISLN